MDILTPIAFVVALAALLGADVMDGGVIRSLINPSAMLLVLGGTLGATLMSFRMEAVKRVPKLIMALLKPAKMDSVAVVRELIGYAEIARRDGLLRLDAELENVKDDFMRHGLMMAIDGTDEALVRKVLESELATREEAAVAGSRLFETAGGFAPTLGIIGTVVGLISVLSNISNAAKLAPSIATAFTATLWGVSSANLFWLPLSNKIKNNAQVEASVREIILEGILAIEAGDNPRVVADKLKSFLTPEEVAELDGPGGKGAKGKGKDGEGQDQEGALSAGGRRAAAR